MIPALGAGGPGFKSRLSPKISFVFLNSFYVVRTHKKLFNVHDFKGSSHFFSRPHTRIIWQSVFGVSAGALRVSE